MKINKNLITKFKIDKSNWKFFKFEEIAFQKKISVDREKTILTKYVKGEHMDSNDIHLRRWGELKDEYLGPAFMRGFEKGDILYGSRRTYLKKVAIAPFSGITSNTTFVIQGQKNKIDMALLPFIMLSKSFTENSINNSKGSVNPYINWKDIAKYQLYLPPLNDQKKLAILIWSLNDLIEKNILLKNNLNLLLHAQIDEIFSSNKKRIKIKECINSSKNKKISKGNSPYIEIGDIDLFNKKVKFKDKLSVPGALLAKKGSTLVSTVRPTRGAITLIDKDQVVSAAFAILSPKNDFITNDFLFHILAWNNDFINLMSNLSFGTTYPTISVEDVENFNIPHFKISEQDILCKKLNKIYQQMLNLENFIEKTKSLNQLIIDEIFNEF